MLLYAQFGSLIAWGIGHIESDIFESYQVSTVYVLPLEQTTDVRGDYFLILRAYNGGLFFRCLVSGISVKCPLDLC